MEKYTAVIFDFDGVLSKDYFYNNLFGKYDDVYNFIQERIFRGNSDIPDKWMRNEMNMYEVNKYISKKTDFNYNALQTLFIESVKNMKIDQNLLNIANQLKQKGIKISLVTNNMDVFNEITVPYNKLNKIFPVIINSCDYGMMKHEKEGKLFDIAMEQMQEANYSIVLLIDDSQKACKMFESKGGEVYQYTNFEDFYKRAKTNLKVML